MLSLSTKECAIMPHLRGHIIGTKGTEATTSTFRLESGEVSMGGGSIYQYSSQMGVGEMQAVPLAHRRLQDLAERNHKMRDLLDTPFD